MKLKITTKDTVRTLTLKGQTIENVKKLIVEAISGNGSLLISGIGLSVVLPPAIVQESVFEIKKDKE